MKWFCSISLLAALAVPAWAGSVNAPSHPAQPRTARSTGMQTTVYSNQAEAPPGVLKFDGHEVNRRMQGDIGTVAGLYTAQLPSGVPGHLVVLIVPAYGGPLGVVQPDTSAFSLRKGERVIVLSSPENGWMRVLPYNGPVPSRKHR